MLEPPELDALDAKEQWVYSKLLLDILAAHHVSKGKLSHHERENHFGSSYSYSFSRLLNQDPFLSSAPSSLQHSSTVPTILLSISCSILPFTLEQD